MLEQDQQLIWKSLNCIHRELIFVFSILSDDSWNILSRKNIFREKRKGWLGTNVLISLIRIRVTSMLIKLPIFKSPQKQFVYDAKLKAAFWRLIHSFILNISWRLQLRTMFSSRSSRSQMFCKINILKNFAKFKGKHIKSATLLKKRLQHRCCPLNFAKFLRTPTLTEHLRVAAFVMFRSFTRNIYGLLENIKIG